MNRKPSLSKVIYFKTNCAEVVFFKIFHVLESLFDFYLKSQAITNVNAGITLHMAVAKVAVVYFIPP